MLEPQEGTRGRHRNPRVVDEGTGESNMGDLQDWIRSKVERQGWVQDRGHLQPTEEGAGGRDTRVGSGAGR